MSETTPITSATGRLQTPSQQASGHPRRAEALAGPPAAGPATPPEAGAEMAAFAATLSAIDGARMLLDLNWTLLDAGRDMLRHQQDVAIETWRQGLRSWEAVAGSSREHWAAAATAVPSASHADFPMALARLSFDALERMMDTLRAANDAALGAAQAATPQMRPGFGEERRRAAPP